MSESVLLLVGTRKGAFVLHSDSQRERWEVRGPFCERRQTLHMTYDPASGSIYAATGETGTAGNFDKLPGTAVWRSDDLGETWTASNEGLTYGEGGPPMVKVWHVEPAGGAVYAGVEPAGLFRSEDGGRTWMNVLGLQEHPSRPNWQPGNGGLCLHSIVVDARDPQRMWVGTSAAGGFVTADGGTTWAPCNRNVRNFETPMGPDEANGCVHKLVGALNKPNRPNNGSLLYQQNHFGVYRSFDAGDSWQEISAGLPSDFGFPMAVHPHDDKTIYVVPLQPDGRYMPDGSAAVWRSRDSGDTWTRQSHGLPQENAFTGVLREALATDCLDPAGVYFGTNTGELFGSGDEGTTWSLIAGYLPPVLSVSAAVVEK